MTIDEAIAHAREKAKEKRKEMQCKTCKLFVRSDLHPLQGYCRKNEFRSIEIDSWRKVCSEYVPKEMCKCAEEHEQIAEWLEELKDIKSDGFTDDLLDMGFTKGYNKAIDDCKELTFREVVYCDSLNDRTEFRELTEQLKAGVKNE